MPSALFSLATHRQQRGTLSATLHL